MLWMVVNKCNPDYLMRIFSLFKHWPRLSPLEKLGYIASLITIISFLFFLTPYAYRYGLTTYKDWVKNKYYHSFAEGLYAFSKEEYDLSLKHFRKSLRFSTPSTSNDLLLWLSFSSYASPSYNLSEKYLHQYVENNVDTLDDFVFQSLAYIRINSLINSGYYDSLSSFITALEPISDLELQEIHPMSLLLSDSIAAAKDILQHNKYQIANDPFYRDLQYQYWRIISSVLGESDIDLSYFLSLTFLQSISPHDFETKLFNLTLPNFNLTIQSLGFRQSLANKLDSILIHPSKYDNDILELYKDDISRFGLRLGSFESLKMYLLTINTNAGLILEKIKSNMHTNEIHYLFSPLITSSEKYLLWVTGIPQDPIAASPDTRKAEEEFMILGNFKVRLIKIREDTCDIINLSDPYNFDWDAGNMQWFYVYPKSSDMPYYVIIESGGTGHYLSFMTFLCKELEFCRNIDSSITDTYHSKFVQINEKNDAVYISWLYELYSPCEANITRKVFGRAEAAIESPRSIMKEKTFFPNPALQFYENISENNLKLQSLLLNKIIIQNKRITDQAFIHYVTSDVIPCYIRTQLDEIYISLPSYLYPSTSALVVYYPNHSSSLDSDNNEGKKYLIMVKKEKGIIEILAIYEIENDRLKKNIM